MFVEEAKLFIENDILCFKVLSFLSFRPKGEITLESLQSESSIFVDVRV